MNHIIGLVISILLFGFFILVALSFNTNVTTATYQSTLVNNTQQSIVDLAEIINFDFSKIGFRKPAPKFKAGALSSTSCYWYSDFDNDGDMDSVYYFIENRETQGPNPNIQYLYRRINNEKAIKIGLGIVSFNMIYYDSSRTQINYSQLSDISGVNKIRGIKVQLTLESQYKINNEYSSTYWEKTFVPKSLNY